MPENMHYDVTATVTFAVDGPFTMTGAVNEVSRLMDLIRGDQPGGPIKNVIVTEVHVHRK